MPEVGAHAQSVAKHTELGNIAKYTKSGTEKEASSEVAQAQTHYIRAFPCVE